MQERTIKGKNGISMLIILIILQISLIALFILGVSGRIQGPLGIVAAIIGVIFGFFIVPISFAGLKSLNANEAQVLILFGKYYGTLRGEGFFYVNPLCTSLNPSKSPISVTVDQNAEIKTHQNKSKDRTTGKKISLKLLTLNNQQQKVNDLLGNPIQIGVVVVWKVVDTYKAVYNVDNYMEYLSIQADSALRNIVREYPYDLNQNHDGNDETDEMTLRGSSLDVAKRLQEELQEKVDIAGLYITEAKITHLAYSQEIAAVMLQRQQASAIIDARKLIVQGAVDMVEMALKQLSEKEIVELDDERKAQMVSNLLVVLCGSKDAQPIVNSGSIY